MWTETTRPKYERKGLRYASDLTEAEWGVIGPLLMQTAGTPANDGPARGGERDPVHARTVADVAEGLSAEEHGPGVLLRWRTEATLNGINHELLMRRVRRCDRASR